MTQDFGSSPKVSENRLRDHFKTVYRLGDDQVEVMVRSSAKSLRSSLAALYSVLDSDGDLSEISRLGHAIKGLLLNMGEQQWAELAREIEVSAQAGKKREYRVMVDRIYRGVEDILHLQE